MKCSTTVAIAAFLVAQGLAPPSCAARTGLELTGSWIRQVDKSDDLATVFNPDTFMIRRPRMPLRRLLRLRARGGQKDRMQQMRRKVPVMLSFMLGQFGAGADNLGIELDERTLRVSSNDGPWKSFELDGEKRTSELPIPPERSNSNGTPTVDIKAWWDRGRPRVEYRLKKIVITFTYTRDKEFMRQHARVRLKANDQVIDFDSYYRLTN